MNFSSGVRVLRTATGCVGNVVSVEGDVVTVLPRDGGETFACPMGELQTLKGRPRKMNLVTAPACETPACDAPACDSAE